MRIVARRGRCRAVAAALALLQARGPGDHEDVVVAVVRPLRRPVGRSSSSVSSRRSPPHAGQATTAARGVARPAAPSRSPSLLVVPEIVVSPSGDRRARRYRPRRGGVSPSGPAAATAATATAADPDVARVGLVSHVTARYRRVSSSEGSGSKGHRLEWRRERCGRGRLGPRGDLSPRPRRVDPDSPGGGCGGGGRGASTPMADEGDARRGRAGTGLDRVGSGERRAGWPAAGTGDTEAAPELNGRRARTTGRRPSACCCARGGCGPGSGSAGFRAEASFRLLGRVLRER